MSTSVSMSKHVLALLLVASGLATQAAPLERDGELQSRENENTHITTGEPPSDRTIFVMISIPCVAVLAFLLGSRVHRLKRCIRSRRNYTALLLLAMYITVICYIIVAAVLVSGQGLYTYELCDAGTWVCLMFYIMSKGFVYFFLCERVHIVRAPFVRRSKDKVYLACVIPAMTLYLIISINSYFWRVTAMHDSDGRCHFGISSAASIPVLSVNVLTNVFLTGVFIYLLRPVVKLYRVPTVSAALEKKNTKPDAETPTIQPSSTTHESAVQKNIKTLLWKSILGAILTELPVAANMIQFLITGGKELGMMCLTFCMVDVFWDALVIHWLTFGSSAEAEKDLLRSTLATQASSQQGLVEPGVLGAQQVSEPSRCSSRREMEIRSIEAAEAAGKFPPGFDVAFRTDSAMPP